MIENPSGIDFNDLFENYFIGVVMEIEPFGNYEKNLSSTKNFTMTVIHMPKNVFVECNNLY